MNKPYQLIALIILIPLCSASQARAHCEIPCGIYGDEVRFYILEEHIATMEKSMTMIAELSQEGEKNYNQLVRWIDNKETHAEYFQDIISQYFMTQRVMPVEPQDEQYQKYIEKITLLHKLLIAAMKAKQSTDPEIARELTSLLDRFRTVYFGAPQGAHRPPQEGGAGK
jgi:nickel superoxide dismutase